MDKIIRLIEVEMVNEDIERFTALVYPVLDDDSFMGDMPEDKFIFKVSRSKQKKFFNFLMDKGMKGKKYISLDFIKEELSKNG